MDECGCCVKFQVTASQIRLRHIQDLAGAGSVEAGAAIIEALYDVDPNSWKQSDMSSMWFGCRALGEIVAANPGNPMLLGAEELVTTILEIAYSQRMWGATDEAANALGKMKATMATELLLKIAKECNGAVAATALKSLHEIADMESEARLIRNQADMITEAGRKGYPPIRRAARRLLDKVLGDGLKRILRISPPKSTGAPPRSNLHRRVLY